MTVPGRPEDGLGEGTSAAGTWLELAVAADPEAVEAVSEILTRVAPGGTAIEPAFTIAEDGLGARLDVGRPTLVRAYVPAAHSPAARAAVDAARLALGHLQAFELRPIGELETRVVDEEDWAHAWKAHIPVLRVGRRIVIRPTWRRHRARRGDVVIALDPGMAFGTGLHPSTRLCLMVMERWADDGRLGRLGGGDADLWPAPARFLDVGCGSGILAIAAGLLGDGEVVALDTDPIAIEATRANAMRNGLDRIRARIGSVPSVDGQFDLVVANLVASILIDLAAALHAELRPEGRLLASGIFVAREPEVEAAFGSVGLEVLGRTVEGEWLALEAIRST